MHKPLNQTPLRLQRMLLRLQKYDIELKYRPGKESVLADTLSRAYIQKSVTDDNLSEEVERHVMSVLRNIPVSDGKLEEIRQETLKDETLQEVVRIVEEGWPDHRSETPSRTHDFWTNKTELTHVHGILFKGDRIVIPRTLQAEMLQKIHTGHMGIEKSKKRARELLYWPGMGNQISDMISKCSTCLDYQNANAKEPILPTDIPKGPWRVFHMLFPVDIDGSFDEM
ncbi:uncharacterized protein K02A2.6-like [Mizuhopecten yessoensis]|uniref:uncharacterized protein K02A2.6-like n=1 Tax=Mizuhopecten yessoensis TaxID=6573 RepID=UPI000B45B089|nr:uncharacterized protein K02A2.6-like [Mizuhopecten yessoensis]